MKTLVAPSCFHPLRPASLRSALHAAALSAVLLAGAARAQTTITVVTTGNINLSTAANWSSASAPGVTNILSWTNAVTGATTDTESTALSVAGLQITNPAGAVTIGGSNTLTVGASGIDLSAATQSLTISDLLALSASQTWTVASGQTLAVTNTNTISGAGKNLTIAGAGNVNLASIIGTGAGGLTMNGTGTLTLSGASAYTGNTAINSGTVAMGNSLSFGPNTVSSLVINGGTLSVGPGLNASYLVSGNNNGVILLTSNLNSVIGNGGDPGGFNFLGTVNIGNAGVTLASSGTATVGSLLMTNGTVISNAGLVLPAGGTFTDTANPTTTNSIGTVDGTFVNSQVRTGTGPSPSFTPTYSNAVVQGPTATGSALVFAGALNQGGSLLGNISIINAYNPDNNGAIVTANGNITLGSNSVTTLNLGGALPGQYDQIQIIGGNFTLGGTLVLTTVGVTTTGSATGAAFVPVAGQTFVLFSPTATVSTLAGTFGNGINLTQAPLSSNLLAWDTSKLASNGVVSVDLANYFWTGTVSTGTTTDSWAAGRGNFTATDSAGSGSQSNALGSFSNVFLTMTNALKPTTQSLGANFTINSLSFIGGGDTLTGTKSASTIGGFTLTLSAANSFQDQNGANYAAGTGLVVQTNAAPSTINSTVLINLLNSQTWELDSAAGTLTVAGPIGGGGGLTKTGPGTLILTSTANTYSGGLTIAGGTVKMSGSGVLGATTAPLTVAGGTLDINGVNQTVSAINLLSGTIINTSTNAATMNGSTTSATITSTGVITAATTTTSTLAAELAGSIGLNKTGPGTLQVLANQLYTGVTNITGGVMALSQQGLLTGGVNVTGGSLAGTGTVSGAVTVSSGATLNPGAVGGGAAGQLALGSLALQPGSILAFNLNSDASGTAGVNYSTVAVTGPLDISALNSTSKVVVNITPVAGNLLDGPVNYTWTLLSSATSIVGGFSAADFTLNTSAFATNTFGAFTLGTSGNNLDLFYTSAIPEPSTVAMLTGLGVLGLATLRRRRLSR